MNLYNLIDSLKWLSRQDTNSSPSKAEFIVCIPALYEQNTIVETIQTFLCQSYPASLISIYIVTSAKEKSSPGKQTTQEVIHDYIASLSKADRKRVHSLHYPGRDGYMAHQVNFVAESLQNKLKKNGVYFVIYNADSHVNSDLFKVVNSITSKKLSVDSKWPTILQQSALYQYRGSSKLAEGAGLHQTLWTLVHEIPKLRKQSTLVQKLQGYNFADTLRFSRIAHCIGHGLFVLGNFYITHPLSVDILNEDLPYGLQACALRESIFPIPSLELASTPNRIANVYLQKSTWFNPFFEFANYSERLVRQGKYISKFEVLWLTIQAYSGLLVWLMHSFVLVGSLVSSILAGLEYILLWIVALSLYWIIPALLVTYKRSALVNGGSNSYISVIVGIPYVLTHSVGPVVSIYRWIVAGIGGTKPLKRKTKST